MNEHIEINPGFRRALDLLEGPSRCVFITGRAGTGKSTLLRLFKESSRRSQAVLAPTGVAALNVGGQTVHSFFGFKPGVTPEKAGRLARAAAKKSKGAVYRALEILIIDEVSMVRPDLLDCADTFLRSVREQHKLPFGGVKAVLIGDLHQLPPVLKNTEREAFSRAYAGNYFFDSRVFKELRLDVVELTKVYRQSDDGFIGLLNAVRAACATPAQLEALNARHLPGFEPPAGELYVQLTTTNQRAAGLNAERLAGLRSPPGFYDGFLDGEFDEAALPTEESLELKAGAQVMMLNNDPGGRWVNGTMGVVTALEPGAARVRLETDQGGIVRNRCREQCDRPGPVVNVGPHTWELLRYAYDEKAGRLRTETAGTFMQLPLRLAWAVTIHKSQGKTFDRMILDLEGGIFASGQLYVALSRCRTLDGIVLRHPIKPWHARTDARVADFMKSVRAADLAAPTAAPALPSPVSPAADAPRAAVSAGLRRAIKEGRSVEIVYLSAGAETTRRVVKPVFLGNFTSGGRTYEGFRARCSLRREERLFRVDRVLELHEV
ncbi:MAG: PIF1 helicase [Elusimicrobia bacterium]|nr:MAG: PIF1 helicase [Elusimicrobiota bacterium]KAF0157108.1 MAG: PIF1 helicase [Elusimicrobiota bacterium]